MAAAIDEQCITGHVAAVLAGKEYGDRANIVLRLADPAPSESARWSWPRFPGWRATRFAFVAPITGKVRPFPSSTVIPAGLEISGEALLGRTRGIDTLGRPLLPSGERIDADLLMEARAKLALLLGIST